MRVRKAIGERSPDVLQNQDFRIILTAGLVSKLGDSIHEIALIWLITTQTGSPALVSITLIASLGPKALLSPIAGTAVDRWNRKRVMIAANLGRGALVLAIPLFGRHGALVPVVVSVALLTGILDAFFGPAKSATIPRVVPEDQLDGANGLVESTNSISRMFYAVAGLVIGVTGSFAAFYVDAFTFLVSAALLVTLSTQSGEPRRETSAQEADVRSKIRRTLSDLREGFVYVFSSTLVVSIVLLFLLYGMIIGPFGVVLPMYSKDFLGLGSVTYGLLYAGVYLGIFVGGLALNRYDKFFASHRGYVSIGGLTGTGFCLIGLGVNPARGVAGGFFAGLCLFLFGVVAVGIWAPARSMIQSTVPDEMMGRVFSIVGAVSSAALPLGIAAAGPLLSYVQPQTLFALMGGTMIIAGLGMSFSPLTNAGENVRASDASPTD